MDLESEVAVGKSRFFFYFWSRNPSYLGSEAGIGVEKRSRKKLKLLTLYHVFTPKLTNFSNL